MTHLAWVPEDWEAAAERTLAGLAERHPSRTILLFPRPEDDDGLELDGSVQSFATGDRSVCAEVIRVRLGGERARHPASVVRSAARRRPAGVPSLARRARVRRGVRRADRQRRPADRRLDGVAERRAAARLCAAREAVRPDGDLRHRVGADRALASRAGRCVSVRRRARSRCGRRGRRRCCSTGWLRSRLGHDVALEHEPADTLVSVYVDGRQIDAPPGEAPPASDLLSDQLDRFARDPIYEGAVRAASSLTS